MNSTIFDWLEASLLWFAGLFGLYGAIWIIFQYRRRKILNNIAGLIIYAIAYADIVHSGIFFIMISVLHRCWNFQFNWVYATV